MPLDLVHIRALAYLSWVCLMSFQHGLGVPSYQSVVVSWHFERLDIASAVRHGAILRRYILEAIISSDVILSIRLMPLLCT